MERFRHGVDIKVDTTLNEPKDPNNLQVEEEADFQGHRGMCAPITTTTLFHNDTTRTRVQTRPHTN